MTLSGVCGRSWRERTQRVTHIHIRIEGKTGEEMKIEPPRGAGLSAEFRVKS